MERHNETHIGSMGWVILAGFVALWDITQEESLSHAFSRGLENSRARPAVLLGLGVTALHLLSAIPANFDPFLLTIDRARQYDGLRRPLGGLSPPHASTLPLC